MDKIKNKKIKQIKGFTLVELIIVISILAILATLAYTSFSGYKKGARDSVRVTTLKGMHNGLQIYNTKSGEYPKPDNYINIVGVSNQGYVGENTSRIIRINGNTKDPLDNTDYIYTTSKNNRKFQLATFLEEKNQTFFSYLKNQNILPQIYAEDVDYTNRYLYTYGDRIGVLLDEETKQPVQEKYGTGELDIESTGSYIVQFTNDTESGSVSGSGTDVLTEIKIVQNSCVLGNTVVNNGGSIESYNSQTVGYGLTCSSIMRNCTNGVLSGDTSYQYDACSTTAGANCTETTYSGYTIPNINHNANQNVIKTITGGQKDISVSCTNGTLTYGSENTNCNANYVLEDGICKEDICTGNAPEWSTSNGTQKINTSWTHNTIAGFCTFVCQAGYYYNSPNCTPASIGYYVQTSGQTTQTACINNDTYQDQTGQTSCKTVQSGYYSTPEGNQAHTNQIQCEANHYCTNGVKTACPVGTNSPAGSTSLSDCTNNLYTVSGMISNGNGAEINGCGKTTIADTSGNFSLNAEHLTNCNNFTVTRSNYTCTITTNGPASLTGNVSNISGSCVSNTCDFSGAFKFDGTCYFGS